MFHSHGITEYPNTFKRQGSFPLDESSVFSSLAEATEYAKSSYIAYEGQIISVTENDKINVYVLEKSNDAYTNFKLANISTSNNSESNDLVADINKLINSKVGIWSITKITNSNEASLDFDIWYGVDANSYEVYFNDRIVSDRLTLSDTFLTSLENFIGDSVDIKLKFYNNNAEAFELNAKPIYKNENVIYGSLYLIELL